MLVEVERRRGLIELALLVLHEIEQAAPRVNARLVEAFGQTQDRRLKNGRAGVLVRPTLMIEAVGAGTVAGAVVRCLDQPRIMPMTELARMDHPRSLRSDRLTVQLLPQCSNSEANVSNIRPRRVEVVIL